MTQLSLTFSADDRRRLGKQQRLVEAFMCREPVWRTLEEISLAVGAPQASVSARLRTMRANGFQVLRERVTSRGGLYKYLVRT